MNPFAGCGGAGTHSSPVALAMAVAAIRFGVRGPAGGAGVAVVGTEVGGATTTVAVAGAIVLVGATAAGIAVLVGGKVGAVGEAGTAVATKLVAVAARVGDGIEVAVGGGLVGGSATGVGATGEAHPASAAIKTREHPRRKTDRGMS